MKESEIENIKEVLKQRKICVVVPTYNNDRTIVRVLDKIKEYAYDIIVVNDGSTDNTKELLSNYKTTNIIILNHDRNKGKGKALKTGLSKAITLGFKYAITIDADGQHYPEDIPYFVEVNQEHPNAIIVGSRNLNQKNMPKKNTFANKFSNFWFFIQTGCRLSDTQTGFRLYPLTLIKGLNILTSRYEAELELLVFSLWSGIEIYSVPIQVYYPTKEEKVSHFNPFYDFFRISVLNIFLCIMAVVYRLPLKIIKTNRRQR
jgi:glycosyltransferase involved in cell wall biosynthesis